MSLGFGAPSSAPATSALSGGFSFGANTSKPATGFGLNTSQPSLFGTPATSAPAFGGLGGTTPGFGAGSTPSFGATSTPGFGATSTPAFGATSTPGFGATSTAGFGTTGLGAGLNFGAGSNTTTTSTGLGFGAPISSATSGGLSFGAPAASAAGLGGFSFTGLPAATSASSLGFGLGSTAATTLPSLFEPKMFPIFEDTPPAQHFMSIPITQTFQMIPQFSMPYQHIEASCYGRSSAQPCDTINQACGTMNQACGTMNQACMTNTDIVHLKNPKRCSFSVMAPSFGTSLGATNTSLAATAAPVNVGLGGLATTSAGATGTADVSAAGKGSSEQQPKQTALPNELSATVEAFKEFVKRQKSLGADVMRVSIKPLQKVSRQAEETIRAVVAFTGEAGRERAHARRLRAAAARALAAAERAGRGPPGADSEDLAPPGYVLELISELEAQLLTFRRQMDVADRQMQAPQRLLTERELSLGMRRMHESLIALAGRLQAVHVQVQEQKERYLELRRQLLKDNTDVFRTSSGDSLEQLVREAGGERSGAAHARGRAVLSDPRAALGSAQHVAGPTPFTYLGSTLSALPAADTTGLSWAPPPAQSSVSFGSPGFTSLAAPSDSSTGFQLQKAPKRGKQ